MWDDEGAPIEDFGKSNGSKSVARIEIWLFFDLFEKMGITDVRPRLISSSFNWLTHEPLCRRRIDAANLLFQCAWMHAAVYLTGDYGPALASFKTFVESFLSKPMTFILVFDGKQNEHKRTEDTRRQEKRAAAAARVAASRGRGEEPLAKDLQAMVTVTSTFIALAAKVCKDMGVKYIVAPGEADGQLAAKGGDDLVVSADGDMLALGVKQWVSVLKGGWYSGAATMVDTAAFTQDHETGRPLVGLVRKHGAAALIAYAFLRGCDFSELANGVIGVGFQAAIKALTAAADLSPSFWSMGTPLGAILRDHRHLKKLPVTSGLAVPNANLTYLS